MNITITKKEKKRTKICNPKIPLSLLGVNLILLTMSTF